MNDFHSPLFTLGEESNHIYIHDCYLFQIEHCFGICLNLVPQLHEVIQMEMSYQGNSGRLTLYMPLNFHASLGRPMFIA